MRSHGGHGAGRRRREFWGNGQDLRRRGRISGPGRSLFAEPQLLDNHPVPLDVGGLQIVEQPTPLTDHAEQAATAVMVALVHLEMLRQVLDAFGQERDLNLRGPRIRLVGPEVIDDFALPLRCQRHRWPPPMTFPSLSGRTALYTRLEERCNGQSPRAPRSAAAALLLLGT